LALAAIPSPARFRNLDWSNRSQACLKIRKPSLWVGAAFGAQQQLNTVSS